MQKEKWDELNFSQEKISGFALHIYQTLRVLLVGAGAIGTHVALALVRKGIGYLTSMMATLWS